MMMRADMPGDDEADAILVMISHATMMPARFAPASSTDAAVSRAQRF